MISPSRAIAFLIVLTVPLASADTVTLKDGTSYEGTVVRETEKEIVMSVEYTNSITDEVVIRREDIRGAVVKTPKDLIEFEKLKEHHIKANSVTSVAYDAAIAACEKFQTLFPESAHRQQVANQIESLKGERSRVMQNEIKVNRRWYTQEEAAKERYQIEGYLLLEQMQQRAAAGDFVGTLNAFDHLETNYPGSAAYPQAVRVALAIIPQLKAEIARVVPIARQQEEKFQENIGFQREPERSRMVAVHRENQSRAERAFKQSKAKWKPFFPLLNESVSSLSATIANEAKRLSLIATAPLNKSVDLTETARKFLDSRKPDEALVRLHEAAKVWRENEAVPRLTEAAKSLKAILVAEQAAREKEEAKVAKQKELEAMEAKRSLESRIDEK